MDTVLTSSSALPVDNDLLRQPSSAAPRELSNSAARQLSSSAAQQLGSSAARHLGTSAARQLGRSAAQQLGNSAALVQRLVGVAHPGPLQIVDVHCKTVTSPSQRGAIATSAGTTPTASADARRPIKGQPDSDAIGVQTANVRRRPVTAQRP